jgi:transcriptional regulator with XRE-family HTH domain
MNAVARELMFAEQFRAPGDAILEPMRMAEALQLSQQDFAELAGVHRATLRDSPQNARLQAYLREVLRVLAAATEIAGSQDKAIFWYRNSPIRDFEFKTAERLVAAGKGDAVVRYLSSIESGSSG